MRILTARPGHTGARRGSLAAIFLLTGLVLVGVFLVGGGGSRLPSMLIGLAHGDLRGLRSQLAAMGASAVLALIVLVLAHTVLPFPAEPLEAAAGFALGFAVALPVLLASFLASAILAYAIGAWIGRPLAGALVGSTRLQSAERLVARGGARGLFAMRLFPLVPFSPLCVACGVMRVPMRRYLWTTVLGMLPQMGLVTLAGARLQSFRLSDPVVWASLAGVLLLVIVGPGLVRFSLRRS